jgi:hypothetical protein
LPKDHSIAVHHVEFRSEGQILPFPGMTSYSLPLLREAIDHDDCNAIKAFPYIKTFITHHLSLTGTFELPGVGFYQDPTLEQYAVLRGKLEPLQTLLALAEENAVPLSDVFDPRTSNTKSNLLILAVQNREEKCQILACLLDFLRRSPKFDIDVTAVLYEAIKQENRGAIPLLISAGANPLLPVNGEICPLILALLKRDLFELIDMTLSVIVAGKSDTILNFVMRSHWDSATLGIAQKGIGLDEALEQHGLHEQAERVRRLKS